MKLSDLRKDAVDGLKVDHSCKIKECKNRVERDGTYCSSCLDGIYQAIRMMNDEKTENKILRKAKKKILEEYCEEKGIDPKVAIKS